MRIRRWWCAVAGGGALSSAVLLAHILVGSGGNASAATSPCGSTGLISGSATRTCTYDTVGSDTFTVPPGVTLLAFSVMGAAGGNYFIDGDPAHPDPAGAITGRSGGAGGQVLATLNVTAGQQIQIDVGGRGANGTAARRSGGMQNGPSGGAGAFGGFGGSDGGVAGGPGDASGGDGGTATFNGGNGSGGGGSSDVRVSAEGCATLTCGLSDRVLVGAGGGGGGGIGGQGNAIGAFGGVGGASNSGCPRTAKGDPANNPGYGCGGFPDGGNPATSGFAPTAGAVGLPGLNPGRHAPGANLGDPRYGGDGSAGAYGFGGAGGSGNQPCTNPALGGQCSSSAASSGGGAGGGGGGGILGGGGGSGGGGLYGGGGGAGGGGGGGSSFAAASATNVSLTPGANCDPTARASCSPTVNNGNGQVIVAWSSTPSPTLAMTITAPGTASIGTTSSATANLSAGSQPTGSITFRLFGPGDTTCQTPLATSTASVAGDGSYRSAPVKLTAAGTYRWLAAYGGDGSNPALSESCASAALVVVTSHAPVAASHGPGGSGGSGSGGSPLASTGTRSGSTGDLHPGATTTPSATSHALATGSAGSAGGAGAGAGDAASASGAGAGDASSPTKVPATGGSPAKAAHPLIGVLIDSTGARAVTASDTPPAGSLSELKPASQAPIGTGGGGASVGWLGGLGLLVLLIAGVLLESDLTISVRRSGAGTA